MNRSCRGERSLLRCSQAYRVHFLLSGKCQNGGSTSRGPLDSEVKRDVEMPSVRRRISIVTSGTTYRQTDLIEADYLLPEFVVDLRTYVLCS